MSERDDILSALTDDGDTYDLDDGRTLRLSFSPDDQGVTYLRGDGTLGTNDDCAGTFAWVQTAERWCNSYGYPMRPSGFDGNAEILSLSGGRMWWQPPSGDYTVYDPETGKPARRGSQAFRDLRRWVLDLLEYGYSVATLELLDTETDAYGRRIVREVASLGGIEPDPDKGYVREIVDDLLSEIGVEA